MFERIKALIHRHHDLREVAALSQHDLDDMGLSREQVEAFVRMPHDVTDRVAAMGQIFGISDHDLKLDYDRYNDLLYTCGHCKDRGACRLVLERGALAKPSDAEFCLNKTAFESAAA